ncbi:vesicular glutamate transporter 1-like [Planococcus citri]|uniref:vesicular glutamate transporter 1-like n=1 Tax=Planococcus citri TaxID=170843 RepID=UPI0031F74902
MLKKRVVLWWLIITGIICHMFLMTNINVAIISMVKKPQDNNTESDKFDWNVQQQTMIFGAYYWFTWISQFAGGILSHKYGSKITFGLSNFIGCLMSSAIPAAAYIGWEVVVIVRVLQGTIASVGLPAGIATIIGQWSPPDERGKFTSVMLGIPLGISIGYTFFGFIADNLSWPYVFHTTMILGSVWYVAWRYFVYDTPDEHPRISEHEKMYIKKSLANSTTRENIPIPWKEILTSRPLLLNIICTFGTSWAFFGTSMFLPMYLKRMHDISPTKIGLITGISFLAKAILQIVGGAATDEMIRRGMSKTRVRNIAVLLGAVIAPVLLACIIFVQYDVFWSLTLLMAYFMISSFTNNGTPVAVIDMSPNFCGIIQGITCALTATTGFFCSLMFNLISSHCDESNTWGYFFLSSGLINVVPGVLFLLFSNSELQPWNQPKESVGQVLSNLNVDNSQP